MAPFWKKRTAAKGLPIDQPSAEPLPSENNELRQGQETLEQEVLQYQREKSEQEAFIAQLLTSNEKLLTSHRKLLTSYKNLESTRKKLDVRLVQTVALLSQSESELKELKARSPAEPDIWWADPAGNRTAVSASKTPPEVEAFRTENNAEDTTAELEALKRAHRAELENRQTDSQTRHAEITAKLELNETVLVALQTEKDALEDSNRSQRAQIEALHTEHNKQVRLTELMEADLAQSSHELATIKSNVIETLKAELDGARASLTTANELIENGFEESEKLVSERDMWKKRVDQLERQESESAELVASMLAIDTRNAALAEELEALKQESENDKTQLDAAVARNGELEAENDRLKVQETELSAANAMLDDFRLRYNHVKEQYLELTCTDQSSDNESSDNGSSDSEWVDEDGGMDLEAFSLSDNDSLSREFD
jgi:DNA repair exonuclease SbcCD ATPase subunit